MIYTPHDYQYAFQLDYLKWIEGDSSSHSFRLYTAPTGTGKSVMELMALEVDQFALLVTTRLEIVAGMLQKLGVQGVDSWSAERLASEALARRITTPVRLRNMLAKGKFMDTYLEAYGKHITNFYSERVSPYDWYKGSMDAVHRILFDEGHHILADTYKDIKAYLPNAQIAVLTATPFRGTAKETDEFLQLFNNEVIQVLSLQQASERGLFTLPTPSLWPLIDDDTLQVVNGEIQVQSATEAVGNVLGDIVERCREFIRDESTPATLTSDWNNDIRWDRPTMFAVPSREAAYQLLQALTDADLPAQAITQDTPRYARSRIFQDTVARKVALVQIDVVSEGVDLPIRRLIDLRPTLSPVKWMQQLGRITRPTHDEPPSEYICTNRNLERHGYLLDGLLPPSVMKQAQEAFANPSKRSGMRVVGLEGIGKFQGVELPLLGGLKGLMYSIVATSGYADGDWRKKEYVVLCHPCSSTPIVAYKEDYADTESGEIKYGKFRRVDKLPDLSGYGSSKSSKLTPRQQAWWARDAARFGLDGMCVVNRKQFPALPVLKDLQIALRSG